MSINTKAIIVEINRRFDELSTGTKEKFELLDEKLDTRLGKVDDQYERKFADLKTQQDLCLDALEKAAAQEASREARIGILEKIAAS
jgi:hypothetical protein